MDPNHHAFDSFYHNFPQAQTQRPLPPQHHQPQAHPQPQPPPQPGSQSHQQYHPRPQLPPQPQPQPQPYHTPPYLQSLPQTYPQYYYNQDQHYQPQFQQYQQSLYPPQAPVVQPSVQSPQPSIQVIVPPHPYHASPPEQQLRQHPPQPDLQSRPPQFYHGQAQAQAQAQAHAQLPSPSQSFQQPGGPPQKNHPPPPHHYNSDTRRQSNVSAHITNPTLAETDPQARRDDMKPRVEIGLQPKTLQQSQPGLSQTTQMAQKPKQGATRAPHNEDPATGPEPDYPSLLCVLADDYLETARKQPALTDEYFRLIATALGCMESALTNFKLAPLREAQVSLRYAQILYQETENYDEAETRLTKSIDLCERHKFVDLKYEMQLLLSKVLYESRPKAALRELERMIDDVEAYRHTVWLYIFRFQHAILSLVSSAPGEVHGATVQLEKIASLARQNRDNSVLVFAAVLEALLHLSSSSHDAITATNTSLAKARSLQLDIEVEKALQMTILMDFIDLSCSIRESDIEQTEKKRKLLHSLLREAKENPSWPDDGFIYIPVSKRSIGGIQLQANGHVIERDGKYFLTFSWISKEEARAVGYLFSADSSAYKNVPDNDVAERFAATGLSILQSCGQSTQVASYQQSQGTYIFRRLLEAQFRVLVCFMQCSKGSWNAANDTLTKISTISEDMGDLFPVNMSYCLLYLKGAILQGTGNLTAALEIYQSPTLSLASFQALPSDRPKASANNWTAYHASSDVRRNFCILAAMNSAFIIHNPRHPQHNRLNHLVKSLDTAVQNSGNKYIQAHYLLLVSVLSTTTLTVKQYLKSALYAAKAIGSAQTSAIVLMYTQEKLFKGTVEEQGIKCAKAASHQVKRWGDPMWSHVAAGLEADSLEVNGRVKEAQQRRAQADAGWALLPEKVQSVTRG